MNRLRFLFLAPSWLLLGVLFLAPLTIVGAYSLLTRGAYGGVHVPWTSENYLRLLDPAYGAILWRSVVAAIIATALCFLLAFPLAYFISRSGSKKHFYLLLVILPFWTSFLIRTYAWMFLLRDTGLVNTVLFGLGWISEPLPLLYNWYAVILGLVYTYVPFMVLPLYATLERLDPTLLEASSDLGARRLETLLHVVLPLCLPGIRAGAILVFIPCLGAYLTPDLLGGGKSLMVGNLVQNQFTNARDWPFGSAVSFALMGIVMALLWFGTRGRKGEELL